MTHDKNGPNNSPIPNAKQFTSEYQPSPTKKSEGVKRYWQFRKARQQMFEQLCDVKLPDGGEIDFWKAVKDKLHYMILDRESDLNDREKTDLILKICKEFMPEDKNVNIGNADGGNIIIKFEEEKDN